MTSATKMSEAFFAVGFGGSVLAYLVTLYCTARREIKNAPRADMHVCEVHGPMPVSATVILMNGDMDQIVNGRTVRGPVRACPMCFKTAIDKAQGKVR